MKIAHTIPIPAGKAIKQRGSGPIYPLARMRVGDSVIGDERLQGAAHQFARTHSGTKFTSKCVGRTLSQFGHAVRKFRVWRVK